MDAIENIPPDVDIPEDEDVDVILYDDDEINLVPAFVKSEAGKKALREIAQRVVDDFERDWESSAEYRERIAKDWRIFSGDLPPKTFPFDGCANAHVPIMLETISRLSFRIQAELFGDWSNVFGVVPIGPDDRDVAEILSLHGNWQLREQIVDFPRQMDRALTAYLVWGDVTCHSYWDPDRETNRHEVLTPDDFVIPYTHVTVMPDYSDLPHYTKILRRYAHEIEAMADVWHGVDALLAGEPPAWDDEPDAPLRESVAAASGIEAPTDDPSAPYRLLQYEGWLKLPGQEQHRWCQVIIEPDSRHILSIQILEQVDWRDQVRYERQSLDWQAYQAALRQWEEAQQARERAAAEVRADPEATPAAREAGAATIEAMESPPPPQPPEWWEPGMDGPEPPKRVPLRMFSHGVCVENMMGALGLSFGRIEADFNRGANIAMDQFIDAATLGNAWSILTSAEVDLPDRLEIAPGKVHKVQGVTATELRNAIVDLKPPPGNPQLVEIAERMYQWGQSAMQAPSVLSGEPGKSGETYRGLAARIEQATKQISVAARKFANTFLRQVLRNNATLNAMFLPDQEIFQVTDWQTRYMRTLVVSRQMYRRNYQVEIRADLRFATEQQRVQEAMELVQLPAQVPPLQGNLAFIYAAVKEYLMARKKHEMIQLLGPEPPPPDTPLGAPPPPPPGPPQGGGPA